MATALFIKRSDLIRSTILDGNVDTDDFIHYVKVAQEIHVKNYVGSNYMIRSLLTLLLVL